MSEIHEIELTGCTPEPLMSYLKALGILRLVSEDNEHGDPRVTVCWRNDVFRVSCPKLFNGRTTEDARRQALTDFFRKFYKPSPIVAPWGARSGFYSGSSEKTAREALAAVMNADDPRFQQFQNVVAEVRRLLSRLGLTDKAENEEKLRLMQACRAHLADEALDWLDTCYVLTRDGRKFPPLLGTGGNEGSGSYVSGFAQQIVECLIDRKHDEALFAALFREPAPNVADNQTPGHFSPAAAGGPNAGQGMEGSVSTNPWDYLLCIEGACLWASGVVRRCGDAGSSMASFPFAVNVSGAGSASLDESDSRKPKQAKRDIAELWLPLWDRFLSHDELKSLLTEGRATVGQRLAASGVDMARASAELGVDRGIQSFQRIGFLMRNGQSFLAVPLGKTRVQRRKQVDLFRQIDRWLERYRYACSGEKPKTPPRFIRTLRRIESTVFDYCRYGRLQEVQLILVALGQAERDLALRAGDVKKDKTCMPVSQLSTQWLKATHDGTPEFDIALALAGIHDRERKVSTIRSNIEPVVFEKSRWQWQQSGPHVVWNSADLATNMAAVLARRMMGGARAGCENLPLQYRRTVSLDTVSAFFAGDLDDRRIDDLLWGLMLIDHRQQYPQELPRAKPDDAPPLPREYALIKLLYLPRPLIRDWDQEHRRARWRMARRDEDGVKIQPEPRILPLLRAGRISDACRIAYQRLRSSGLTPLPGTRSGGISREQDWEHDPSLDAHRLAAALLLPVSEWSVNKLVHLVTRQDDDLDSATLVKEGADAS